MELLEHIQQFENNIAIIKSEGHLLSPDDHDVVQDISRSVRQLRKRFESRMAIEELVRRK